MRHKTHPLTGRSYSSFQRACAVCLAILPGAGLTRADSWESPRPVDYTSANGSYVFHVIPKSWEQRLEVDQSSLRSPAVKEQLPLGRLVRRDESETNVLWSVQLVNDRAPLEAVVADDGQHVVTLDNWASVGYGPDVVAFYGPKGLLHKYSLEEALAGVVPTGVRFYHSLPAFGRYLFDLVGLGEAGNNLSDRFTHSMSSRCWREYCFHLIESDDGHPHFCLWLAWERKWLVFRMTDGKKLFASRALRKRLIAAGRAWALEECRSGESPLTAARYLLESNRPEDRPLIGEALARVGALSLSSMLQPVDAAGLKKLAALPGIRAVETDARVGDRLTLEALLAELAAFPTLERLNLQTLTVSDAAAATLGGIRTLRMLGLRATQLTDAGLAAICRNDQLEELWLDETSISDAGVAALKRLQGLRVLNLEQTFVTDAGLVHLTGLTSLTNLHLSGPVITDSSTEHLLKLRNLCELWLLNSAVTDTGVARLAGLPHLDELLLNNSPITDRSLATFREMPQLRVVFVWNTGVSGGAVAELKRARSDLEVVGP